MDNTESPPPISGTRTHCKHDHPLADAYIYPRVWISKKTGESRNYSVRVCRTCILERDTARNRARGHRARPAPAMPTDPIILAYAAGIFDGEGTVGIRVLRKKGNAEKKYHSVVVAITSTEPVLTNWLQINFGGRVNPAHKENAARNYKDAWKWTLLARHAAAFLTAIYPYLLVKRPQADVALELRAEMGDGHRKPIDADLFVKRDALKQEMHRLNRRGRDPDPIESER